MTTTTTPAAKVQQPLKGQAAVKAVRKAFSSSLASAAAVFIGIIWTIPTFGLLVNSFRSREAAATTGWWEAFIHPSFSLSGYNEVLTGGGGLAIPLVNSLAITIPATIIPIFVASMAGYALAWMRFKGSDFIFFGIFALQVVPLQMALVPLQQYYVHGLQIFGVTVLPSPGINGTIAQIWLTHTMFSMPLAIFLIHNFIAQLPSSLMEAARVDGPRTCGSSGRSCCRSRCRRSPRSGSSSSSGCGTTCSSPTPSWASIQAWRWLRLGSCR